MKDPSSLNMSSSGLSHKNLLAPLLVSKQSVSPGPSASLCSYLEYFNFPAALHFLPAPLLPHLSRPFQPLYFVNLTRFCLSALFTFSVFCHLCLLLSPLRQFHFNPHYSSLFVSTFFSHTTLLSTSFECYHPLFIFPTVSFLMQHTTTTTYLSLSPSFYLYSQLSCL